MLSACQAPLQGDEAMIVGQWQCNTRNGAIWLFAFRRDHSVTLRNVAVDADGRKPSFDSAMFGTWNVDGIDLVYALDRDSHGTIIKKTTRIPLSEFKHAAPLGTDRDARWERM